MLIQQSRIPYLANIGAVRADPLTGCGNGKDICAVRARGQCWAENMAINPLMAGHFRPAFHPEVLDAIRHLRKPRVIALNFGGDMFSPGVDPDWRRQLWEVVREHPEHTYITLTKNPLGIPYNEAPDGVWLGVSVVDGEGLYNIDNLWFRTRPSNSLWVAFEPLLMGLDLTAVCELLRCNQISYAVIGGLTDGNRHVLTPDEGGTRPEWVQPVINACHEAHVPMFLKNLQPIIRELTNPRTGERFKNQNEIRDPWPL